MRRIMRLGIVCLLVVLVGVAGMQLMSVSPTLAATFDRINATCQLVSLRGKTEVDTPFVRVQVLLASDLSVVVGDQIVPTGPGEGAIYTAAVDISAAHIPENTLLFVTAGEWDGTQYIRPATFLGIECNFNGGSKPPKLTLVPSATATGIVTITPRFPRPTVTPMVPTLRPTKVSPSPTSVPTATLAKLP